MDDIRYIDGYEAISAEEARERFGELVDRVGNDGGRIIVTRGTGRSVAIVPIDDIEVLSRIEDAIDIAEAKKILASLDSEGTIPLEEIKARLGLD